MALNNLIALRLPKASNFDLALIEATSGDVPARRFRTRIVWILALPNLGWMTLVRVLLGDRASQSQRHKTFQEFAERSCSSELLTLEVQECLVGCCTLDVEEPKGEACTGVELARQFLYLYRPGS